jgi:hypothetical protein
VRTAADSERGLALLDGLANDEPSETGRVAPFCSRDDLEALAKFDADLHDLGQTDKLRVAGCPLHRSQYATECREVNLGSGCLALA